MSCDEYESGVVAFILPLVFTITIMNNLKYDPYSFNILGEIFYLEIIIDKYYITHQYWSLSSSGNSKYEAIENLFQEAREIYNLYYKDLDYKDLEQHGRNLKQWLHNLIDERIPNGTD